MNFFQAQDQARRNTFWLVLMFAAAVVATIGIIYAIIRVSALMLADSAREIAAAAPDLDQISSLDADGIMTGASNMLSLFTDDSPQDFVMPDFSQLFILDTDTLIISVVGVLALVSIGSLYKIIALSGGGANVAESMGGRLVLHSTRDPGERRLLNIVEEMAIAAGAPMPGVYLLPDGNINAFAAGTTPSNAVIGVTRGAMQHLSREEMQGVVAHEFSHIMNGDMRFNLRLLAIIHGIMLVGYLGYFLFRSSIHLVDGNNSGNSRLQILLPVIGFTLMVAGFIGTFFGSLIRASISRQREYLADAAAVQYTRHPLGIAGALERIGQLSGSIKAGYQNEQTDAYKNRLDLVASMQSENYFAQDPHTIEYSHMFFSNAVAQGLSQPFATHPPLKDRVSRVMPDWSEDALINTAPATVAVGDAAESPAPADKSAPQPADAFGRLFGGSDSAGITAAAVIGQLGTLNHAAIKRASAMVEKIPPALARATEEPYAARALIYALLLDRKDEAIRAKQLAHIREHADTGVYEITEGLLTEINPLPPAAKLPLVQSTLPTLRLLSQQQYDLFLSNMGALIAADEKIGLFEWCLQAIVIHALHDNFSSGRRSRPRGNKNEAMAYALSFLARVGQQNPEEVFTAATQQARLLLTYTARPFDSQALYDNLQIVAAMPPKKKEQFAHAAVSCASHDDRIDANEAALLRAYFMIMDCPMPLLLADE